MPDQTFRWLVSRVLNLVAFFFFLKSRENFFDICFVRVGGLLFLQEILIFERRAFYSSFDSYDRHHDMRLDVDNMTYEELLALEERIGNVSTGLADEDVSKCLSVKMFSSSTSSASADEAAQKCSICQEEYEDNEEIGTLSCGHDHHTDCIKKWLVQKNECPICKAPALKTG
eukprot:TRINITY_DN1152_c0_g1_i1.p1 TRINITY_DN1152_c0_g1~~TRINITY_DN1152_c0_g1_i1.p1  ORF type:complete len:172 (-),score=30.11 TRINITY_DN1152_c0_g1_i1:457-972(-)